MPQRRPSTGYESLLQPAAEQSRVVMQNPTPDWLRPENDSVLDSPGENILQSIARFFGLDDPNSQVLGAMNATEVPGGKAALNKIMRAFKGTPMRGRPGGTLAQTLTMGAEPGVYNVQQHVIDRLQHFFEIGQKLPSSDWAAAQSDDLLKAFDGNKDAARTWLRLWGATSPGTGVPANTKESVRALLYHLDNPQKFLTADSAQTLGMINTPSKWQNINNAYADLPLSGDKAEAMAGFSVGEPRLPQDVHFLYGTGSKHNKFDKEIPALRALFAESEGVPLKGSFTKTDIYLRSEDAFKRALSEFADGDFNPIFGTMWEGIRAQKGLKYQGGPIDILRKKGLLEVGAMLDPKRLRAVLKTSGWTAGAIAAVMTGIEEEQAGGAPEPAAPASGPRRRTPSY